MSDLFGNHIVGFFHEAAPMLVVLGHVGCLSITSVSKAR